MTIAIDDVVKTFDTHSALNLEIDDGSFVALLGPSGSGKTTLLRIIAGLEAADSGHIRFRDEDVTERAVQDRGIGFVFQQYALFRHMTVTQNIAFGLKVMKRGARPHKDAIAARVDELLELVQLPGLGHRYPAQLSGGQRQRVALARALLLAELTYEGLREEAVALADKVAILNHGRIEQYAPPDEIEAKPASDFVREFIS